MNENPENFNELIDRLKSGDRLTFRNDLETLVRDFGSFRPLEDVAKLSSENEELLKVLLELTKEFGQGNKLGLFAFHTARRVGPAAIAYIREAWQMSDDSKGLHHLHMCLMDIAGASGNEEEWRARMPVIAEQEIPLWIAMARDDQTQSRGLIAWAIGLLTNYAAAEAETAGRFLLRLLDFEDSQGQTYIVRGLLLIGDKNILQESLFSLARVGRDAGSLELLLSRSEDIDLNARNGRGKSALEIAEESGNKTIAKFLVQT